MPLRVLITGFEPFDGASHNPSGDVAEHLDRQQVTVATSRGVRVGDITGVRLPVLWDTAGERLVEQIHAIDPHIVISLGMAHATFRVEEVADDRRIHREDNARVVRPRRDVAHRYSTRLPLAAIEDAIRIIVGADRVTASRDAGGFICNEVFFTLMRIFATSGEDRHLLRAGFIHVPGHDYVPSRVSSKQVDDAILAALRVTLGDLADTEYDACTQS